MEEKKLNELNDEKLDQVAGGGRHGRHSDYGASMTILGHTISTPTELNSFVYGELAFEEKYRGRDYLLELLYDRVTHIGIYFAYKEGGLDEVYRWIDNYLRN